MQRTILHADLNNFYASVECLYHPEVHAMPVAVCGDPQARHGIVLAKNERAKAFGVRTGEVIWQARQKCPDLVILPPHHDLYAQFSIEAREIFASYTDQVEPFGLDEAWLDVTHSLGILGDGQRIASDLRAQIRSRLGITASCGVSWNKIFAKLGSDIKKPDATTTLTPNNYRQIVWPLPVEALLYVGPSTKNKLHRHGIYTIGQLAAYPRASLRHMLGKRGEVLHLYANGRDDSAVARLGCEPAVKSIGNSSTAPRDLKDFQQVKALFYALGESVCLRLRGQGLACRTLQIQVRDNALHTFERQKRLEQPTNLCRDLVEVALDLFRAHYDWKRPIRSLGFRALDLSPIGVPAQISLFHSEKQRQKQQRLECCMDSIRDRFGSASIQRGLFLQDEYREIVQIREEHALPPLPN